MLSPSSYVATTMHRLPEPERGLAAMRLEAWALLTGARPYSGRMRRCLGKLSNPRHHCGRACYPWYWPDVLDHAEWWKGPAGEYVVTAHPYGVSERDRCELESLAGRFGAALTIDPAWSWYAPDSTVLVVLWGVTNGYGV